MGIPVHVVTAAQVRPVAQPLRYRGGVPVAYRCPGCGDWHPYTDPKIYDMTTSSYHGTACDGADSPDGRAVVRAARPGLLPAAPCADCGSTGGHVPAKRRSPYRLHGRCAACASRARYRARRIA